MDNSGFIPLDWNEVPLKEMKERAKEILSVAQMRRTTRHFSTREVPKELIEKPAELTGGTAPMEPICNHGPGW